MARTLAMRATSLLASTGLLALAAIGALSFSWTIAHLPPLPDGPVIISEREPVTPPPSAPPVQHTREILNPTQPSDVPSVEPNPLPPTEGPPGAVGSEPGPTLVTDPHWLATPRDLSRYYPPNALRRDLEGDVQLDCVVTIAGELHCAVASETPSNWSFGAAAIRIAQDYRMVPAIRDGVPVEGRYHMHVPIRLNH